jgi:uncharacterized protein
MNWLREQWAILRSASPTQWVLFIIGTVLLTAGIGAGILASTLGAGPADALVAGAADISPLTVGTWAITISVGLLIFAWLLGTPPLAGTILSFVLFGALIDFFLLIAPTFTSLPAQIAQWLIGAVLLAVGAGFTIASGVGASAYDMATVAISTKIGGRLGLARLVLDGVALIIAFLIGGPIAWGTAGLMVVFPLVMPFVVKHARRLAPPLNVSHV